MEVGGHRSGEDVHGLVGAWNREREDHVRTAEVCVEKTWEPQSENGGYRGDEGMMTKERREGLGEGRPDGSAWVGRRGKERKSGEDGVSKYKRKLSEISRHKFDIPGLCIRSPMRDLTFTDSAHHSERSARGATHPIFVLTRIHIHGSNPDGAGWTSLGLCGRDICKSTVGRKSGGISGRLI